MLWPPVSLQLFSLEADINFHLQLDRVHASTGAVRMDGLAVGLYLLRGENTQGDDEGVSLDIDLLVQDASAPLLKCNLDVI